MPRQRAAHGTLLGAQPQTGTSPELPTTCKLPLLPTGGAAHSFEVGGYKFDAGPSFFLGIDGEIGASSPNPLKQVGHSSTTAQALRSWCCRRPDWPLRLAFGTRCCKLHKVASSARGTLLSTVANLLRAFHAACRAVSLRCLTRWASGWSAPSTTG